MKGLAVALWAETLKARRSKMLWVTLAIFAFIAVMMGLLEFVAAHPELAGRSATITAKASRLGNADWPSYFGLLIQAILALGPMGFGIVTSWVFGREYSDRVVKDLLALPVSRLTIVLSKFVVIIIWNSLLSVIFIVVALLTGLAVNISGWSGDIAHHALVIFTGSALLTILLCTPVALIASIGRGYLLPIGFVILILILTQFVGMGFPGIMPFFPWAIPAVCSGVAGTAIPGPTVLSYAVLVLTSLLGFAGTAAWWRFADQN